MTETVQLGESEEVYGQRLISLDKAAASLSVSERKLKALLLSAGKPVFYFGSRSKRVAVGDLNDLIKQAASE
jgi:hypothetical protein